MSDPRRLPLLLLPVLIGLGACGSADRPDTELGAVGPAIETDRAHTLTLACTGCHSDVSTAVVSLIAYDEIMLRDALMRYKTEQDGTTVMHRLARGYSEEDIREISARLGAPETRE